MRILALGMDGADHELVEQLMAEGRLPTISRLTREGTFGPLRSSSAVGSSYASSTTWRLRAP